jgi:hypothetical protein
MTFGKPLQLIQEFLGLKNTPPMKIGSISFCSGILSVGKFLLFSNQAGNFWEIKNIHPILYRFRVSFY